MLFTLAGRTGEVRGQSSASAGQMSRPKRRLQPPASASAALRVGPGRTGGEVLPGVLPDQQGGAHVHVE